MKPLLVFQLTIDNLIIMCAWCVCSVWILTDADDNDDDYDGDHGGQGHCTSWLWCHMFAVLLKTNPIQQMEIRIICQTLLMIRVHIICDYLGWKVIFVINVTTPQWRATIKEASYSRTVLRCVWLGYFVVWVLLHCKLEWDFVWKWHFNFQLLLILKLKLFESHLECHRFVQDLMGGR